ncbi:hypothetical protein E8E14_011980 [Neopestalotiopsis sp. 37M]|nr:hypothetical protein E8E14_011980 [Neopestalotiopsis sp. 37M]
MLAFQEALHKGSIERNKNTEDERIATDFLKICVAVGQRRWDNGDFLRYPKEQALHHLSEQLPVKLSHLESFRHSPLPEISTNIQLLSIHPAKPGRILRCTLRVADINERPEFTALSYSWTKDISWKHRLKEFKQLPKAITGPLFEYAAKQPRKSLQKAETVRQSLANMGSKMEDPESSRNTTQNPPSNKPGASNKRNDDRTIICNGRVMEIGQSLYDALLQLRKRPATEYWIDAICINLQDEVEKTAQLAMMGKIYHTAKVVLVWLGVCPTYISPGMTELKSFSEKIGHDSETWKEILDAPLISRQKMNSLALIHLLSRRYFQRIWVLQEMALARNLVFLLGEHSLDPETLYKIADVLGEKRLDVPMMPNVGLSKAVWPQWTDQFVSMPFPRQGRGGHIDNAGTWSLHGWLKACVGRQAERPRDLVFAGLSLVDPGLLKINAEIQQLPAPGMEQIPRLWSELHVDCTLPTPEIMLNLVACIISDPGDFYLLSISSQYRRRTTSESSCGYEPNVAASWMLMMAAWCSQNAQSLADSNNEFCAATKLKNDPKISADGRRLFLSGARLGTVRERLVPPGAIVSLGSEDFPHASHIWRFVEAINKLPCRYRDTEYSSLAALANVCTWGSTRHNLLEFQKMVLGFCLQLDKQIKASAGNDCVSIIGRTIFRHVSDGKYVNLEKDLWQSLKTLKQYVLQRTVQRQQPEAGYNALKNEYPEMPWPEAGTEMSEEDQKALEFYNKFYNASAVTTRRVFTTHSEYIGLAWAAVRPGDEVILIKGAKVPYIFRPVDDALRVEIETVRNDIDYMERKSGKSTQAVQKLRDKMQDLESRIGKDDGWVLVGEAYVEGVMDGEIRRSL